MLNVANFLGYYVIDESIQVGASFKSRGVENTIGAFFAKDKQRVAVTFTSGNHGIAVAYLSNILRLPKPIIVVPEWVEDDKKQVLIGLGASVVNGGDSAYACELKAIEISKQINGVFIHPYKSKAQILGYTSLWSEIDQAFDDEFDVIMPVGSGGLMASAILYRNSKNQNYRIIGVEPKECASLSASLNANKPVLLNTRSMVAPALNVNYLSENLFDFFHSTYDCDLVQVSDTEIQLTYDQLTSMGIIVDPAVAACFSYAMSSEYIPKNRKTLIILTGKGGKESAKRINTLNEFKNDINLNSIRNEKSFESKIVNTIRVVSPELLEKSKQIIGEDIEFINSK